MQAVARKELRSRMRGGRAFAVLSVYLLLLSLLVIAIYAFTRSVVTNEFQNNGGGAPPPVGRILFYGVTIVELLLIAPLAPAFSAASIAGERERQTFDLVMTTPLSARSFVLGKLFSSLSYVLLLVIVALPVQVLALLFGGLSVTEVLLGFWTLVVAATFYASSSLFFSATMKSAMTATVFSYLVVALSLIGAVFFGFLIGVVSPFGMGLPFLFEGPNNEPTTLAIYLGLFAVSLSPLTAGGASALLLIQGESPFFLRFFDDNVFRNHPDGFLIASPWITYTLLYLGLSALLVWLSIRSVRPTHARNAAQPARPPGYVVQPKPEVS